MLWSFEFWINQVLLHEPMLSAFQIIQILVMEVN
jgi:hypothetical protein